MKGVLVTLILAMMTLAGAVATAQGDGEEPVQREPMTVIEVVNALQQKGYSNIRRMDQVRPYRYEVEARNADGDMVELAVDAETGQIAEVDKVEQ
jgi:hypothetical protein